MFAHRLLGGCSSSLSISCPFLGSVLIAVAHARLWSLFRRCSESPLLAHQETKTQEKVSCLFGSSILFPRLLPASCGTLAPFRLCSRSQPQSSPWDLTSDARASAPSPYLPQRVSRQASQAGECWSALILCGNPSAALCTPVAVLSSMAPKLPPAHPPSLPVKGLPSVWKLFLLHSSLPLVQVLSLFFCLLFFLLLYPGTWGVSCLLGSLRSSVSVE